MAAPQPAAEPPDPSVPAQSTIAVMPPPPPLPELPPTPIMSGKAYPDCREDHAKAADAYASAAAVNQCIAMIDRYRAEVLAPFQQSMIDHQERVIALYENEVREAPQYPSDQRAIFYDLVMQEHADSNPDGPHLRAYTAGEARYQRDRAYLSDRFCFYTGCMGYAAPVVPAGPKAAKSPRAERMATGAGAGSDSDNPSSKPETGPRKKPDKGCGTERAGAGLLGGVLGGVLGKGAGAVLAGQVGGALLGEIACRLTKKEQEQAEQATLAVVRSAEVGATAAWVSDSRPDVSGSSTIIAVNSQPSGQSCLTIVDVVIVEGEEARVSKQMCRKPGEARYTLVA